MGGKRPDQYAIDYGEANTTDYKNVRDQKIHEGEKEKVAQTRVEERESMIPRRGENPALADLRARREAAAREESNDHADERAGLGGAIRAEDAERTE